MSFQSFRAFGDERNSWWGKRSRRLKEKLRFVGMWSELAKEEEMLIIIKRFRSLGVNCVREWIKNWLKKLKLMDMETIMDNVTNSTEFEEFIPYSARIETYLVPILFSIIFVSGIVGNLIICIIFIRHPSIRNVPNTYVTDLNHECDFFSRFHFIRIDVRKSDFDLCWKKND